MEHYTYRVTWNAEEQEHLGLCAEFPRLSHFDSSPEAALVGIVGLVRAAAEFMKDSGQTPPEALADRTYSGVFKVRLAPSVHRQLVLAAAEEGVSVNSLVQARLARIEAAPAGPPAPKPKAETPRAKPRTRRAVPA